MKINTSRFGEIEIEEEKILSVDGGLLGFSELNYIILNPDKGGPFCWFQSVDNPDLAFVVVDPLRFVPGYQVKLTSEEYQRLMLEQGEEIVLLSVVTMAKDPRDITLNLQGPIVINPARMIAMQVVLSGNHTTRHPLFAAREQAPAEKGQADNTFPALTRLTSLFSSADLALSYA